jgi:hypothetical protein
MQAGKMHTPPIMDQQYFGFLIFSWHRALAGNMRNPPNKTAMLVT